MVNHTSSCYLGLKYEKLKRSKFVLTQESALADDKMGHRKTRSLHLRMSEMLHHLVLTPVGRSGTAGGVGLALVSHGVRKGCSVPLAVQLPMLLGRPDAGLAGC